MCLCRIPQVDGPAGDENPAPAEQQGAAAAINEPAMDPEAPPAEAPAGAPAEPPPAADAAPPASDKLAEDDITAEEGILAATEPPEETAQPAAAEEARTLYLFGNIQHGDDQGAGE